MRLDQFAERDRHRLFDRARLVDVAGDAEELGADIVRPAEGREPGGAAAQDGRRHGDRLDIVDGGRAAIEADIGREWRLQARLALLALEAFEQRRLLAADIGAGAVMDVDVEIVAVDVVLADQPGLIGLVDGALQRLALADELAAHIDVGGDRAHGEAGDQAALDQRVRIVAQDVAVLAGAGLGFVGIDDEVGRPAVALLGHERPFQAGREAGAAAAAQARRLHLVDDPVAALGDDAGLVSSQWPRAIAPFSDLSKHAVDVVEDAVFVLKHCSSLRPASCRRRGCIRRRRPWRAPWPA